MLGGVIALRRWRLSSPMGVRGREQSLIPPDESATTCWRDSGFYGGPLQGKANSISSRVAEGMGQRLSINASSRSMTLIFRPSG